MKTKIDDTTQIKPVKTKRGGARKGTGPKPKYNEPTTTMAFRCPESKTKEMSAIIRTTLKKWERKDKPKA